MFKRMMTQLRSDIEFMVYHGRQEIVIQLLWKHLRQRHRSVSVEEHRQALINLLDKTIASHVPE